MSSQHLLIDNVAFAKRHEHVAGELSSRDCGRLSELLCAQVLEDIKRESLLSGCVRYVLDGETDAVGRHFLHLAIAAELSVICQRCLDVMPLTLNLSFDYLIVDEGVRDMDVEDNDDFDEQQADQAMDLLALIEDELIIAMPIAPMHEGGCGSGVTESGERSNPFAVLKALIKS